MVESLGLLPRGKGLLGLSPLGITLVLASEVSSPAFVTTLARRLGSGYETSPLLTLSDSSSVEPDGVSDSESLPLSKTGVKGSSSSPLSPSEIKLGLGSGSTSRPLSKLSPAGIASLREGPDRPTP